MGAIQNAINAMIGTTTGTILAATKISEGLQKEAEQVKKEEIGLTERLPAVNEEIEKGSQEIQAAQSQLEKTKSGRNEKGQFRKKSDVMKDVKMGELAVQSLEGKQKARIMQRDLMQKRYNEIRGIK